MSQSAEKTASASANRMSGKEFEETFKPKSVPKSSVQDKSGDDKKGKDKKKKKSGFKKLLIVFLILVVLLGGAGAALYFSGNLTPVFNALGIHLPSSGPSAGERQAALDQREAKLDAREEALNKLQEDIDKRQAALDAAEEPQITETTFEDIRAGFSEDKLTELQQVGTIYTKMDPAAAAAIVMEIYDAEQIAVIIYYMQPAASALVLEKLDPVLAADVTKILAS